MTAPVEAAAVFPATPTYGDFHVTGADDSVYIVSTGTFAPTIRPPGRDPVSRDFVSVISLGTAVTGGDPESCARAAASDPDSLVNVLRVGHRHVYVTHGSTPTHFLQPTCTQIEPEPSSAIEHRPTRVVVAPVDVSYVLTLDSGAPILINSTAHGTPIIRIAPAFDQRAEGLDGVELLLLGVVAAPDDGSPAPDPGFLYTGRHHWLTLQLASTMRAMLLPPARSIHRLPTQIPRGDQP